MHRQICQEQLFSRRNLLIIVMTLLGLLLVLYINQCNAIAELKQEQRQVQTQIALAKGFLKAHPNGAGDERAMGERLARIDRYLPNNLAIEQFVAQMVAIAAGSDIKIVALTIGQASQGEAMKSVVLQLKLEGSYLGVLEFLRKLGQGERFFSVDACEVSTAAGMLNCNVFIKIYEYLPININQKQEYDK